MIMVAPGVFSVCKAISLVDKYIEAQWRTGVGRLLKTALCDNQM